MSARVWLLLLAVAAIAFGCYARFKGIATWPVAVDEYYILRSVQNVLSSGLPRYDCGGLYTRGIVFQYITAGLQLGGATPELAGRLVAAVASLITLPAAYLIGRRLHGHALGLLVAVLLALSVWEVEIARFARMYAPFQAVFTWYVVCFLRYYVDGERRALWGMLILSVLGALIWEGGLFLAVLNLLPPFLRTPSGRLTRGDWARVAGMLLLLVPIGWFVMADLRASGTGAELPVGFVPDSHPSDGPGITAPWRTITDYPLWLAAALVPLGAALFSIPWMWRLRDRWLAAAGLGAALGLALVHQFAACGLVLILLLLTGAMQWREYLDRAGLRYVGALLVALAFWSAFGLATHAWIASDEVGFAHKAMLLSYELVRFPNFIQEVVRPWGGAVPLLSLGLALTITIAAIRVIARPNDASPTERALLVIILVMIAAASASGPPRHETRYIFFLYPLMLLIATLTTFRAFEALRMPRTAVTAVAVTAVAALFAATEDFSISHLAHVDSANVNFRVGATRRETAHLLPRADVRAAADWLALHPQRGAVVINAFPSVDFYYPSFDFTYIDSRTARFEAYACRRGTRERWGNLPLIHEASAIELRLASGTPVRVVASAHDSAGMLRQFDKWNPQVAWRSLDGGVMILDFRPQPTRMNAVAKQARSPDLPGR